MKKIWNHETLVELVGNVVAWSHARNIINGCSSADQFLKLDSEFGELCCAAYSAASAFNSDEKDAIIHTDLADGIGDCLVVLINISEQENVPLLDNVGESLPIDWSVGFGPILLGASAKGRLADAIKKRNKEDISTYVLSFYSALEAICHLYNLNIQQCLFCAYNEIKDRKGVMYNGTFVKSDDANYERICEELGLESKPPVAAPF